MRQREKGEDRKAANTQTEDKKDAVETPGSLPASQTLCAPEERLVLTLRVRVPLDKHGCLNRNMRHILQTPRRVGLTFHSGFSVS